MESRSQAGEVSLLLVSLILVVLCLFGAIGFGGWAFSSRQDYKNNVDQKITLAVADAKKQLSAQKDKEFAEKEKYPLATYKSSAANGSINVKYPKTWSAYVIEGGTEGNQPLNAYFQPNVVPDVNGDKNAFALRVQLLSQSYSDVLDSFGSQVQQKQVTTRPYKLKKVPNVVGSRIDGQIEQGKRGSIVILPLRDKTLEISTEAQQYEKDFNNIILPNVTFLP